MLTQPVPYLSPEEYLEIERAAEFRSEYVNGTLHPVVGSTLDHSRIVANTLSRLTEQLRGLPCAAAGIDLRLYSAGYNTFIYPDILVTCGPDQFLDNRRDTITDATFIIEVLSPSTRSYDRGEKFVFYRSLPSFSEYLLIGQDSFLVEHHCRQPDGSWLFREFKSPADEIELTSIGCTLRLEWLYERVDFSAA